MQRPSGSREVRKAVSAVSASKKEQATRVKKHVVRRQKGTMAAAPKSHVHVKKLTVEEGVRTGKNSVHQLQAQVDTATQQESSQGPVLLSQLPETTSVPYTPETMGQQLTVSLSGEPYGPSAMPSMCPSLILQPCATTDPMLLQPQGSSASNQASVSATLEWQEMLEAAEALLALKNSSQTRHQPCGMPGTAGERGLQLPNPSMPPRPASSGSLPSGHLDCMSLLT
ncbi:doublesex- and mab-3-related transcription factor C1 [Rattus norvegicus]|uniref:Doublesex- and mab-3-related transcription factor C1 n=1 Tax=Rattus norvegicus TaxID=10116 RepID=DMRTC_RAT|nr:doublesex- and mab-3-related transcription factor C1 [Rattus norvegicus]Q4QR87.1 RecName: Full=Doublesex- and mab-3-related transcription factor C1 [Rattus norvegicus]AAH97356.1 DMRT-like family C1a [Rattus norvegicus]|eukprot:NP_001020459.1 doublesex- and mab-3-related transcription factor C1 [Rattus norvegicus]